MKLSVTLCGLLLAVAAVNCGPVAKREAAVDDLSPLNENEDEEDRGDRDKRKIGIVKLGVSNGIINFVFGKLDTFLDAKTKALAVLDEGNKAKNAAFEIDSSKSATSEFINKFIAQKLKATSGSVGPLINAGTTFLSSAKQGLAGAFVSKFAPLSSLSGGLAGGLSGGSGGNGDDGSNGGGGSGGLGGSDSSSFITGLLGSLSGSSGNGGGLGGLGSLSAGSGGLGGSGGNGGNGNGDSSSGITVDFPSASADAHSSAGFANLGGGNKIRTTTEEDIPEFDRTKVSLDVPPQIFGGGFTLITNISKIISSLIMNSAKRTESVLEVFKPLFRGKFAIKGLPSDNPKSA